MENSEKGLIQSGFSEIIQPQPGPQAMLLSCSADIAIFGGQAGGGKTYGLLLDFLHHTDDKNAGATFFRRTTPEIREVGGPWDAAEELYTKLGAEPKNSLLKFVFPSGAVFKFSHMEEESDRIKWQGSQIPVQYWDELTHFSKKQFWYLQSRNRSIGNIKPYIRASTNPDPDSWVYELIKWWIDPDTGFYIPERSGVLRYFYRHENELFWSSSPEKLKEKFPELGKLAEPVSLTFIPSKLEDNKILMDRDPRYKARLLSLAKVDRDRLLHGNWLARDDAGDYFKREYFTLVEQSHVPSDCVWIRFWDRAGTSAKEVQENKRLDIKQARTASAKLGFSPSTMQFYLQDVTNDLLSAKQVVNKIDRTVADDGIFVTVGFSQDPGQAGKFELNYYKERYGNYDFWSMIETGSKESRAKPVSAQAEKRRIKLVIGPWNETFMSQAENFPHGLKDIIDALSGAFAYFVDKKSSSLDIYENMDFGTQSVDNNKKDDTPMFESRNPLYDQGRGKGRIMRNNW